MKRVFCIFAATAFVLTTGLYRCTKTEPCESLINIKEIIIFQDSRFYCAFPSVVKRPDGEILVAFRRAPSIDRYDNLHFDPDSELVLVRSYDGQSWTTEPELIYKHPYGGSQDPCLFQLRDGTLLCTSYGWALTDDPEVIENLNKPLVFYGVAVALGGYLLRSTDGGKSWQGPEYPPHITPEVHYTPFGDGIPAYNRGSLYEGESGRIFWAVAATDNVFTKKTSVHLITSDDKGITWSYRSPIAVDENVFFNETSIYETPNGDIVTFLRTEEYNDFACIARSTDGGKTFGQWESLGFRGFPLTPLRLPDNRVLLTYGHRYPPHGIRARILNAECTDFSTAKELVLRNDGDNWDIGYPWPVQLDYNKFLVVYYFNNKYGDRYIAGTIIEIN